MNRPCHLTMDSPLGTLFLQESHGVLRCCRWSQEPARPGHASPVLDRARHQLEQYFNGERTRFDLPFEMEGTAFEQAVWRALSNIPYGTTSSYRQLAEAAGHPGASRALGSALGRNRLVIILPCHRVIRASGQAGHYTNGAQRKAALLSLEKTGVI